MNDRFDPGPPAEVALRRDGTHATLVFVRELRHSPHTVWRALTSRAELPQWAPFTADRDLDRLGDATLTMIDGDEEVALPAKVTRCDAPSLLEYTWGDDVLRWQLEPTDRGTRLTLHHTTDDPSMVPKVAAGWHICIAVAERLLDGDPVGPIVGQDAMHHGWQRLHDEYAAVLGVH
jgi:uncharacterized protein YndB with AHSA1/START domain